jgi:PAS domain S-box-containing protein
LIQSRKREHDLLVREEQLMDGIFRATPVGLAMLLPGRRIEWANDTLAQMTGYSRQELQGKNSRFLYFTDEEYERVGREKYGGIKKNGKSITETTLRRRDGVPVNVFLSACPLDRSDPDRGIVFAALDITRKKRDEVELARQKNIFATLSESSPDVVFIYDGQERYRYINKAVERYAGRRAEDFIGRTNEETGAPPNLVKLWREMFLKVVRTGKPVKFEFTYPTSEGPRDFVETDIPLLSKQGLIDGVVGFSHDVTELKRIQAELETIFRAAPVGMGVLNISSYSRGCAKANSM